MKPDHGNKDTVGDETPRLGSSTMQFRKLGSRKLLRTVMHLPPRVSKTYGRTKIAFRHTCAEIFFECPQHRH